MAYAAVVLAGGSARRLGGVDKPSIEVGGRSLLTRVLHAVEGATERVVVGPERVGLPRGVRVTREQPPGGGPVAALAAGVAALGGRPDAVVVLAADLPFVTAATVDRLVTVLSGSDAGAAAADDAAAADAADPTAAANTATDAAVLVDRAGRRQWLCAAWRGDRLAARLAEVGPDVTGVAMRTLLDGVRVADVPDDESASFDCDTEADVQAARTRDGAP